MHFLFFVVVNLNFGGLNDELSFSHLCFFCQSLRKVCYSEVGVPLFTLEKYILFCVSSR